MRISDWSSDVCSSDRYDLIVANPPYVPTAEWKALAAEYRHEPKLALAAGGDGMDIVARILENAARHLSGDGWLVCEVGGSVVEFEARWPKLPVTWVEFENEIGRASGRERVCKYV